MIIVNEGNDHLKIWDTNTGQQLKYLDIRNKGGVGRLEPSPDGFFILYTNSFHSKITKWSLGTWDEYEYALHTDRVFRSRWSPDSEWFISASKDSTLRIWGSKKMTLVGHTDAVYDCDITPDGNWIVSASGDQSLKIWDAVSGAEKYTLNGHTRKVIACATSPDGKWILSISEDNTLKVWSIDTGLEVANFFVTGPELIQFNPTKFLIACRDMGGNLFLLIPINLNYEAIIITATDEETGLIVRCTVCQHSFQIEKNNLGSATACPQPGCNAPLKINPFVKRTT
jgi:WD40 repeat protein